MGVEIERKFLVADTSAQALWRAAPGVLYRQGYLNRDKTRTVRARATRAEFEYAIPLADAQALLALCDGPLIEKTRHVLVYAGTAWVVVDFAGDNAGLVVAEVELQSEAQAFEPPDWLGEEVTQDARYFNSNLASWPFRTWD